MVDPKRRGVEGGLKRAVEGLDLKAIRELTPEQIRDGVKAVGQINEHTHSSELGQLCTTDCPDGRPAGTKARGQ